jgi:hypothetical protein
VPFEFNSVAGSPLPLFSKFLGYLFLHVFEVHAQINDFTTGRFLVGHEHQFVAPRGKNTRAEGPFRRAHKFFHFPRIGLCGGVEDGEKANSKVMKSA